MSRKAQIQAMLADAPTDAFLRFALAKEHEKEGDDAGAKKIYTALINDQPEYVGTYYRPLLHVLPEAQRRGSQNVQ